MDGESLATTIKADLTARENLAFHARLTDGEPAAVDPAIERLDLSQCGDIPAGQMSAGQRRRTALARLLLGVRRLWILDEPFTALDDRGRDVVEEMMHTQRSQGGLILFTSHQAPRHHDLSAHCRELSLAA